MADTITLDTVRTTVRTTVRNRLVALKDLTGHFRKSGTDEDLEMVRKLYHSNQASLVDLKVFCKDLGLSYEEFDAITHDIADALEMSR